ncbi:MAG: hypothetical protein NC541_06045 [bacterium]|nr:hypothetical protein [bacterium]
MRYLTFPWEELGGLLRRLSLSGGAGNVAAWILFLVLGLCPAAGFAALLLRKRHAAADWLLLILSALLLAGLWFFVNPSYLEGFLFPAGLKEAGKLSLALTVDSAALAWLLLRFLTGYEAWGRARLFRVLRAALSAYLFVSGAALLIGGAGDFSENCAAIKAGNAPADPGRLALSLAFLFLQTACSLLPDALDLILWGVVLTFLRSCEKDGFSAESLKKVELLKKLSARFLAAVLFGNLGVNLLQLLLGRNIYSSRYSLVFPLRETVILSGMLMLSRFYLESRRLKEDNDLFI